MKHIGRVKILQYNEYLMKCVCQCPHCGKEALYGDMMMTSGVHNCPKCNAEINRQLKLDREADYDVYVRKANNNEYEPYRYVEENSND